MREYLNLSGGVQVQPYDLWWLSEMAREGVKGLASMYGDATVILSGFTPRINFGGGISGGTVLYKGLPVDIPESIGEIEAESTYKLIFEDVVLPTTVFNGTGVKVQKPYKMAVGTIGTCKKTDNDPMKLSSLKRIDVALHDMLKGLLVSREVSIASGYSLASVFRNSTTNPFSIRMQGNTVYIGGRFDFNQSPFILENMYELITKIPTAYRPINPVYMEGYGELNGVYKSYLLELTTSGVLRVRASFDNPYNDIYDHIIINPTTYFVR